MRSGVARTAAGYCAAIMEFVSNAVLTVYKRRSSCTGGKTNNDVDSYVRKQQSPAELSRNDAAAKLRVRRCDDLPRPSRIAFYRVQRN